MPAGARSAAKRRWRICQSIRKACCRAASPQRQPQPAATARSRGAAPEACSAARRLRSAGVRATRSKKRSASRNSAARARAAPRILEQPAAPRVLMQSSNRYRIRDYAAMIADARRTSAYRRALRRAVRPGSTVLDLGTGSGVLALIACRLGARRVIAVEPDDVIELARALARENGCADRIRFVQGTVLNLKLARRVDVLVSDLRGILPYHDSCIAAILDARRRLLRPGGAMIPARDVVVGALLRARSVARHSDPWRSNVAGLSLEAMWHMLANTAHPARLSPADLASTARRVAVLDYRTLESATLDARIAWRVAHSAAAQGLALWFDSQLAPGAALSNAPGRPPLIYGQTLLPWPEPVRLRAGERVVVRLRADPVRGAYVWRWSSEVLDRAGRTRCRFDQSTFLGQPISRAALSASRGASR